MEGGSHGDTFPGVGASLIVEEAGEIFDTIPDNANGGDDVILEFTSPATKLDAGTYITIALHKDYQVPEGGIDISQ